mmetsp:Transcript_10436/g.47131  ORF Transcript_10436/g.47131 Transcript_10436/m.47131 type:complete len:213 (+) Transcript_10436:684-1322(+)
MSRMSSRVSRMASGTAVISGDKLRFSDVAFVAVSPASSPSFAAVFSRASFSDAASRTCARSRTSFVLVGSSRALRAMSSAHERIVRLSSAILARIASSPGESARSSSSVGRFAPPSRSFFSGSSGFNAFGVAGSSPVSSPGDPSSSSSEGSLTSRSASASASRTSAVLCAETSGGSGGLAPRLGLLGLIGLLCRCRCCCCCCCLAPLFTGWP